jgi:chaperonin cofactor prefoldin
MQLIQTERSTLISKQKLELVLAELSAMPEDVPTYKQIGKA